MVFKHEVSSKECGPSLPLLHWNQPDNLPITRTIHYHIKRDFLFFLPPLLFGPELKNHCFWCREQPLCQECGRDGEFIKTRALTWAWKVTEQHQILYFLGGNCQEEGFLFMPYSLDISTVLLLLLYINERQRRVKDTSKCVQLSQKYDPSCQFVSTLRIQVISVLNRQPVRLQLRAWPLTLQGLVATV